MIKKTAAQQSATATAEVDRVITAALAEVRSAVFALENIVEDSGAPDSPDDLLVLLNEFHKRLSLAKEIGARHDFIEVNGLEKFDQHYARLTALYQKWISGDAPATIPFDKSAKRASSERKVGIVAIVDTETTGLEDRDEIISVGIILYEIKLPSGELIREIGRYYGLREPSVPIHPGAHKVHGISIESLRGLSLDMPRIDELLIQAEVIIAHYAKFDFRMLSKIHPPVKCATWACSCLALREYWSHLPNRKLDTICAALGVRRPEPHNAMSDCLALAEVLFTHSGVTKRSRTFMGHLALRPWMPAPDESDRG